MNCFILCGGKNSRFNFQEKALEPISEKSSIEFIIDQLQTLNLSITLIANSDDYIKLKLPILPDKVQHLGPIGGLFTALNESKSDWNFIIAADMPFFHRDLITYLDQFKSDFQAVVPEDHTGLQPLAAFYHKSCLKLVENAIKQQQLSLIRLIKKLKCNLIPIDQSLSFFSDHLFFNMNNKADLKEVKHLYATANS